eukprot:8318157-Pyramimonas_sp.AAC.1
MRRRAAFTLYLSFDSQRGRLRQHCITDSVDVRGKFICGETCYDIWLCLDQEGDASDDKCKPAFS